VSAARRSAGSRIARAAAWNVAAAAQAVSAAAAGSSPALRRMCQVAYGVVFAIADSDLPDGTLGARAATITSLLMLGVPETRAIALVGDQP